jgi:hypothetical protein
VEIVEQMEDKEWGYRQFTVRDLNGNRVTFFRFLGGGDPTNDDDDDDEEEEEKVA